jgi:hypothetical protein
MLVQAARRLMPAAIYFTPMQYKNLLERMKS